MNDFVLNESGGFAPSVPAIQYGDMVLGGPTPESPINNALEALAQRTRYLQQVQKALTPSILAATQTDGTGAADRDVIISDVSYWDWRHWFTLKTITIGSSTFPRIACLSVSFDVLFSVAGGEGCTLICHAGLSDHTDQLDRVGGSEDSNVPYQDYPDTVRSINAQNPFASSDSSQWAYLLKQLNADMVVEIPANETKVLDFMICPRFITHGTGVTPSQGNILLEHTRAGSQLNIFATYHPNLN